MKNISPAMKAHLAQEVTTIATCWRATLTNGTVFGFTDHSRDIDFEGTLYAYATGFAPSAVETTSMLNVDNMDVQAILDSSLIKEEDLIAGIWDFAKVEVFWVNWADHSMGRVILKSGTLGQVKINKTSFTAEVRGLTQAYTNNVQEVTSPMCRAKLGDSRCKIDLGPLTAIGAVESASADNRTFYDATLTAPGAAISASITNISRAAKAVVTTSGPHGFSRGQQVLITGVVGVVQTGSKDDEDVFRPGSGESINGYLYSVRDVTETTFEILVDTRLGSDDPDDGPDYSSVYSPYVSGGTAAAGGQSAYYDYGMVQFTSGMNTDLKMEVKSYTPGFVELQLPMPYPIAVGDSYTIQPGCGKRLVEDCYGKFDNVINFRGEPYLPGFDKASTYASHDSAVDAGTAVVDGSGGPVSGGGGTGGGGSLPGSGSNTAVKDITAIDHSYGDTYVYAGQDIEGNAKWELLMEGYQPTYPARLIFRTIMTIDDHGYSVGETLSTVYANHATASYTQPGGDGSPSQTGSLSDNSYSFAPTWDPDLQKWYREEHIIRAVTEDTVEVRRILEVRDAVEMAWYLHFEQLGFPFDSPSFTTGTAQKVPMSLSRTAEVPLTINFGQGGTVGGSVGGSGTVPAGDPYKSLPDEGYPNANGVSGVRTVTSMQLAWGDVYYKTPQNTYTTNSSQGTLSHITKRHIFGIGLASDEPMPWSVGNYIKVRDLYPAPSKTWSVGGVSTTVQLAEPNWETIPSNEVNVSQYVYYHRIARVSANTFELWYAHPVSTPEELARLLAMPTAWTVQPPVGITYAARETYDNYTTYVDPKPRSLNGVLAPTQAGPWPSAPREYGVDASLLNASFWTLRWYDVMPGDPYYVKPDGSFTTDSSQGTPSHITIRKRFQTWGSLWRVNDTVDIGPIPYGVDLQYSPYKSWTAPDGTTMQYILNEGNLLWGSEGTPQYAKSLFEHVIRVVEDDYFEIWSAIPVSSQGEMDGYLAMPVGWTDHYEHVDAANGTFGINPNVTTYDNPYPLSYNGVVVPAGIHNISHDGT